MLSGRQSSFKRVHPAKPDHTCLCRPGGKRKIVCRKKKMRNIVNRSNLKKAYYYLKRNGIGATLDAVRERTTAGYFADYTYQKPDEEVLRQQKARIWEKPVLFSILVPAYETREEFLAQLLDSLLEQTYPHWELLLLDAGNSEVVRKKTKEYEEKRIRYFKLETNGGISENSQAGLKWVRGDYVGLLDHDDYLTPDALYHMADALEKGRKDGRGYSLLYSDEDKCDEAGERFFDPHFKTGFNLDLLLTNNYICHFLVMKRELIQTLGFRKTFDGAQDYDLILRAVAFLMEKNPKVEEEIFHLPRILYHWRCHGASTAVNPASKSYAYEAGRRALEDFLAGRGWKAKVSHMRHVGFYRIEYEGGIFSQRPDVGARGGKRIRKGRLLATAFGPAGEPLYQGLPAGYSGYMHRAVLAQNVDCLDMDYWEVNPAFLTIIETFLQEAASNKGKEQSARAAG